jgi:hypothetical protein
LKVRTTVADPRAQRNLPDNGSQPEEEQTVMHFACECGHKWQREMYDSLIEVGCPVCGRKHLTNLGRFFLPIIKRAKPDQP